MIEPAPIRYALKKSYIPLPETVHPSLWDNVPGTDAGHLGLNRGMHGFNTGCYTAFTEGACLPEEAVRNKPRDTLYWEGNARFRVRIYVREQEGEARSNIKLHPSKVHGLLAGKSET